VDIRDLSRHDLGMLAAAVRDRRREFVSTIFGAVASQHGLDIQIIREGAATRSSPRKPAGMLSWATIGCRSSGKGSTRTCAVLFSMRTLRVSSSAMVAGFVAWPRAVVPRS
jgi:hypothetical protein